MSADSRTVAPKVHIFTVADLLTGKRPNLPTPFPPYVQAKKLVTDDTPRLF